MEGDEGFVHTNALARSPIVDTVGPTIIVRPCAPIVLRPMTLGKIPVLEVAAWRLLL